MNGIERLKESIAGTLVHSKTPEEELEEQKNVSLAESYLISLGVEVRTDYGYYHRTYDILKNLGECLSKKSSFKISE